MDRIKKQKKGDAVYFAAINPIDDIIHLGKVNSCHQVETGQPLLFTSKIQEEVYDMAYSEWNLIEDPKTGRQKLIGTPREFEFSSYTSRERGQMNSIISEINRTDNFKVIELEHPNSSHKLIAFSEYAFSKLPEQTRLRLASRKIARDGKRIKKKDL